jgi:hypothetical protein
MMRAEAYNEVSDRYLDRVLRGDYRSGDHLNDALELGERVSNLLWHTPCARALTLP